MCDKLTAVDTQEQIDSAFLRERFLKSLMILTDEQVTFQLAQNSTVEGTFKACDYSILQFHVQHLQTPSGVHEDAILRTADIFSCAVNI